MKDWICQADLRIPIGNSPPSDPKPYKANFYYTGIEISIPVFSITILTDTNTIANIFKVSASRITFKGRYTLDIFESWI